MKLDSYMIPIRLLLGFNHDYNSFRPCCDFKYSCAFIYR